MPGSVQNATPTTVLPQSLCRAFTHSRAYPALENEYRNGESQRSVQAVTRRKRWRLTKRLTPAQLVQLRSFLEARGAGLQSFFYDGLEPIASTATAVERGSTAARSRCTTATATQ